MMSKTGDVLNMTIISTQLCPTHLRFKPFVGEGQPIRLKLVLRDCSLIKEKQLFNTVNITQWLLESWEVCSFFSLDSTVTPIRIQYI